MSWVLLVAAWTICALIGTAYDWWLLVPALTAVGGAFLYDDWRKP